MNYITGEELWKPINVSGLSDYKVSDTGVIINNKGNIVNSYNQHGYRRIDFKVDGKRLRLYVHRIVALSFIDNNTPIKIHVNHKNGIKHDNRVSNLEWCTPAENNSHAWETGLMKPGERHKYSKYRDENFLRIVYERLLKGINITDMAKEYEIDTSTLSIYLKDLYGSDHIEGIYNSEVHNRIPESRIDEFYQLILSGWTIQDISKNHGIDEDVRNRIYRSYGKEHISKLLKRNVSIKRQERSRKRYEELQNEISGYYKLVLEGKNFSEIGEEYNVSHKTIRKRLDLKYGKEHIDDIRFS